MDLRSGFQSFLLSLVPSEGVGRRQRQGVRRGASPGVCTTEEGSGVVRTRGVCGALERGPQSQIKSRGVDGAWQVQPAGPQRGSARGCHGRGLRRAGQGRKDRGRQGSPGSGGGACSRAPGWPGTRRRQASPPGWVSGLPTGAANSGPPGSGSQGPGQGHSLGEGARTADFWAFLTKDWNGRILEPEVMFRLVLVARGAWRSVLFGSTSGSLP